MDECHRSASNSASACPAFNNDEIIIPSFIDPRRVARRTPTTTAPSAAWRRPCPASSGLSLHGHELFELPPQSLLIAMNDGVDPQSGTRLTQGVGHFRDMTHLRPELEHAWDVIIRDFTRHQRGIIENVLPTWCSRRTRRTCSARPPLCEDCIGRGLTPQGGRRRSTTSSAAVAGGHRQPGLTPSPPSRSWYSRKRSLTARPALGGAG